MVNEACYSQAWQRTAHRQARIGTILLSTDGLGAEVVQPAAVQLAVAQVAAEVV